ncbi:MAG TPA: nucleoside deaminase [Tissierellia bacterium]|nr:nucleoside deaminase [Tissierellia bacterium]
MSVTDIDRNYLRRAVDLAKEALQKGDQPFGSVLVSKDGEVLFEDHNHVSDGDHTQHPEFNIARWAAQNMTPEERQLATVYTSGEHCPMCSGAHGMVGLGRIVIASSSKQLQAWREEMGAPPSNVRGLAIQEVIREIVVDGPVPEFEEEIKELQRQAFERGKNA